MMNAEEFRRDAHKMVDWMADFLENIEQYPVKSQVQPREIYDQVNETPPDQRESMKEIMEDFESIILPGITHWQHPNFYAYFQGNSSYPSILAEMLTATLGAQCMIWDTSPAAAELEEKMMNWLKQMCGLPMNWEGTIQSTASDATLSAILSARESLTNFQVNDSGYYGEDVMRVYCSSQTHSSIEKGAKIAGIGKENVVKIDVDETLAMKPSDLRQQIEKDLNEGKKPICVISTIGTTSSHAIDPVKAISELCEEFGIWHHIDAAHAGSAMILPEYRYMIEGIEKADSYVFNPHKWMFTNFDCSAYFVKSKEALIRTFEILPEYLKTQATSITNNYRDWGIPLGRRFRALKLWFVIRDFGVEGIQEKIKSHIEITQNLAKKIRQHPQFELLVTPPLNLICFRYNPGNLTEDELNQVNETILNQVNETGKIFFTHTKLWGKYTLRMSIGQTRVTAAHVDEAWGLIEEVAIESGKSEA